MRKNLLLIIAIVLSSTTLAMCDRMSIPIPVIPLEDNVQLAIIAWNGTHEVLILSTIIKVEISPTLNKLYLVELLPFKTVPEAKRSTMTIFWSLDKLFYKTPWGYGFPLGKRSLSKGEVEVIYEKKIGVHQLALVKFNNSGELVNFVKYYAKKYGVDPPSPSKLEVFKEIFSKYLAEGYQYASVDIVEVKHYRFMVEPIKYVFKSSKACYPLRVSNAYTGSAYVRIYLITNKDVDLDNVLSLGFRKRGETTIETSILGDNDIALMFKKAKVILLEYTGLSHFDSDFEAGTITLFKRLSAMLALILPIILIQLFLLKIERMNIIEKKEVATLTGLAQLIPNVIIGVNYALKANITTSLVCGVGSGAGLLLLLSVIFKKETATPCYTIIFYFLILMSLAVIGLIEAEIATIFLGVISILTTLASIAIIFPTPSSQRPEYSTERG